MKTINKYVGLDVHKDTTVIAVAEDGRSTQYPLSPLPPVQVSRTRGSYREVLDDLVTGWELPCDIGEGDEFLTAVIDGILADIRVGHLERVGQG